MSDETEVPDRATLLKRSLFVPLRTKEALRDWIATYLNLVIPDTKVDPTSTASPMDALWYTYRAGLFNDNPDLSTILSWSSRDSFKTLAAAILEVLFVVHLKRNVAHMAAIEPQAVKAQVYVKGFFRRPGLRDFIANDAKRRMVIRRFEHLVTKENINTKAFEALPPAERLNYTEIENYIVVVICTLQGANCVDPSTLVTLADGGAKEAFEVQAGDRVRSFDVARREFVEGEVEYTGVVRKPRMRVTFDDGGSLVLSEDHLVFTDSGWRYARALHLQDQLFSAAEGPGATRESGEIDLEDHGKKSDPVQVLLGTLLGDASMTWPKNKMGEKYGEGPRLAFNHSSKQFDYLEYKVEKLKYLGLDFACIPDGNGYKAFTKISPTLSGLFQELYGSGKKVVTQAFLDQLTIEGVAYWFMDDGAGNPEEVGSRKDHPLSLATCGFSQEENQMIADWFSKMFQVQAKVGTVSNSSEKVYPVIQFDLASSRRLSQLMAPYFYHSLKYKLLAPEQALHGRCIDCGVVLDRPVDRNRFVRCQACPKPNGRNDRMKAQDFKARFTRKISKLEFLPSANLIDIHIKTEDENRRNFIANNAYLLHNSEHVPFMVIDEVDVVPNPRAYEEAKMIPAPMGGFLPITLLTSTRKVSTGLVQKELDNAPKSGLVDLHWNIIDVTERCPQIRHLPHEPKIPIYVNDDRLEAFSPEKYNTLSEKEKSKFRKTEGFAGCLKNCKIFAACQGNLATKQRGQAAGKDHDPTKPITLLKPIAHVQNLFGKLSPESAQAQLLCRKPSQEGLIYSRLSREKHVKSAAQIYEMVTGEKAPTYKNEPYSKKQLVAMFKERGARFYGGMDWGFTHAFAVPIGVVDGNNLYIIDGLEEVGLDPAEKVRYCNDKVKHYGATYYPDPESPSDIAMFKKHGYKLVEWSKGPGSVQAGIEALRLKINPFAGEPQIFFLEGDGGAETVFIRLAQYKFKLDVQGNFSDQPDEEDDDTPDATRYLVMNVFPAGKKIGGSIHASETTVHDLGLVGSTPKQVPPTNLLRDLIEHATGLEYEELQQHDDKGSSVIRSGGLVIDI